MSKKPSNPAGADRPPKEHSFEESLSQLETIIDRIEGGKVGLEGAIAEYERGVTLLRRLRETLRKTEQRVEELNAELATLDRDAPEAKSGTGRADEQRADAERGSW